MDAPPLLAVTEPSSPDLISKKTGLYAELPNLLSLYPDVKLVPSPLSLGQGGVSSRFCGESEYVDARIVHDARSWLKASLSQTDNTSVSDHMSTDARNNHERMGSTPSAVGFLRAGPRERLFFDPSTVKAAILTAGGLCPGLNSVIKEIVDCLFRYGCKQVFGVRFGYEGLYNSRYPPLLLSPESVRHLHQQGGTLLGSSRGGFDLSKICDAVVAAGYTHLYVIGGDGTHRGAIQISDELLRRRACVAVVGVPKSIDNDLNVVDKCFGFDTAVDEACKALACARVEADCAVDGVVIVQLMGRNSGYIAAHACLSSRTADICLLPEVEFDMESLLKHVYSSVITDNQGCVICMSEAAGLSYCKPTGETDRSGNPRLPEVSAMLKDRLCDYSRSIKRANNVRVINPSYMVRSVAPNTADRQMCTSLAWNAVHAAMTGYTSVTVGSVNNQYVMIPMSLVAGAPRRINPHGLLYQNLLERTNAPDFRAPPRLSETPPIA